MILPCLRQALRALFPRKRLPRLDDLPNPETMRNILVRERIRSDRTGVPFSVITYTLKSDEHAAATWSHLVTYLRKRLRLTDDMGWFSKQQICVVLPHTNPQGAWKVADDVLLDFPTDFEPPHFSVYTYPWQETKSKPEQVEDLSEHKPKTMPVSSLEVLFFRGLPWWKRGLDLAGASAALVLLLPVFAVVAAAVKLTSRGPILFVQQRSGLGGKPFAFYKFRSMVIDAETRKQDLLSLNEQDGPAFKIKNDPRITPLGRFLRVTSLDELPQLWNILRGEMTFVGPRPLPCNETNMCESWHRERLFVTPGLTCIWQVRGRSRVRFCEWVRMDVEYIRSQSFTHDLTLLVQTVPAVLSRRGAQ